MSASSDQRGEQRDRGLRLWTQGPRSGPSRWVPLRWVPLLLLAVGLALVIGLLAVRALGSPHSARGLFLGPGVGLIVGLWLVDSLALRSTRLWRRTRLSPSLAWLRLGRAQPGLRCAFCHAGLAGAPLLCRGCGAAYHAPCADELRGCASLGCASSRQGGRAQPQPGSKGKVTLRAPVRA